MAFINEDVMESNKKPTKVAIYVKSIITYLGFLFLLGFAILIVVGNKTGERHLGYAFICIIIAGLCGIFAYFMNYYMQNPPHIKEYISKANYIFRQSKSSTDVYSNAIGAGSLGGLVAGVFAHFWFSGKIIFGLFVVISILTLSSTRGFGRIIALLTFGIVAGLTITILEFLSNSSALSDILEFLGRHVF
jgi:hypothetical protein